MPRTPESLLVRRFGTTEPPVEARRLCAGRLEADLADGQLRSIRYGGIEIIRGISYVIRDKDWGSYTLNSSELHVTETRGGFFVRYEASCVDTENSEQAINLSVRIECFNEHDLIFEVTACPVKDFVTARCGFTILHPLNGTVGQPALVNHADGSEEKTYFSDLIEPWQPFKNVRAITHYPKDGLCVSCRMEGDVFETEDQRAWSDASFKTYVRPLALPWPYILPEKKPFKQSVRLRIRDERNGIKEGEDQSLSPATLKLGPPIGRMPDIGLILTPEVALSQQMTRERIREINPRLLLLHYDPAAGHDRAALQRLKTLTDHLGDDLSFHKRLEFAVPIDEAPQIVITRLRADLDATGLKIDSLMLCPDVDRQSTPPGSAWPACPSLETIYAAARTIFPDLLLGGGMMSYFTELNRKRPPRELLDFVAHGTSAIVHAADDLSVMQTLQTLPDITRSTRQIIGVSMPYHIAPASIAMRQNPYGARLIPNPARHRQPMTDRDPRQAGTFAAAWQVGYFAGIASETVESVTVGIVDTPMSLWDRETIFPIHHTSRVLSEASGRTSYACQLDNSHIFSALAFEKPYGARRADGVSCPHLLLSNLTDEPQELIIDDHREARIIMRLDDEGDDFSERPLRDGYVTLSPYATMLVVLGL